MKLTMLVIAVLSSAGATLGQTQVQCRQLQQNDFLLPTETIVGSGENAMVCHSVVVAKAEPAPAPRESVLKPTPVPAATIGTSIKQRVVTPFQASVGYQYDSVNFSGYGASTSRTNTNGVFVQGIGNVSRYVSVIGNFDAIYKNVPITVSDPSKPIIVNNQTVGVGTTTEPGHDYLLTYTGGIQAYPMAHRDWAPFVRTTFGAGTIRVVAPLDYCSAYCFTAWQTVKTTGFAWQIGGGVDYRPRREARLAFRLGQFDYSQMRKNGVSVNSFKFGSGVTF